MEGKGRSEDNTEDFMEDGGRLRRILVRMEDIFFILFLFIQAGLSKGTNLSLIILSNMNKICL